MVEIKEEEVAGQKKMALGQEKMASQFDQVEGIHAEHWSSVPACICLAGGNSACATSSDKPGSDERNTH